MLVDSHCHIHLMPDYPTCVDAVITAAKANQVETLLNVSTCLEELPQLLNLAQQDSVYISVGVHPNEQPGVHYTLDTLKEAALSHPKVIGIGETGLDYYRQDGLTEDLTWQQDRFVTHMHLARELKLPLIIHSRQARQDTIDFLRGEQADQVGGVMHCFTEDWDMAVKALDLGFYISLSGIVTFKNAVELQEVAKRLPPDRILVETDCPYLAPIPFRGKVNQPAYVKHTAEFIAQLRGVPFETLAQQTTENFHRLFFKHGAKDAHF